MAISLKSYGGSKDIIILACELNRKQFEISIYKQRIYNAYLLSDEVYICFGVYN
ncbi:hypothetical protein CN913_27245 [Bacillus cereus]|nr:hypothetical protein CN502_27970 [Bacillus cereus]PGL32716.1 hypothetical protein CN913_27245 [Bacillus cereus]